MRPFEWITIAARECQDITEVYQRYKEFKKETGSMMLFESFKRSVRKKWFFENEAETEEVRVLTEAEGPNLHIVTTSSQIRTLEQLLAYCRVDLGLWNVKKHIVNSWGSQFQVKAWMERRSEPTIEDQVARLIDDAKKHMPKYSKIKRRKRPESGNLLELSLFDHHFGQLSWGDETRGTHYDIGIAGNLAHDSIDYLLSRAEDVHIDHILLPIGNDFFNVNSMENTTIHGTRQDEDERWKKTFVEGRRLWVSMIEKCLSIAPVTVKIVLGNHDAERTFYLGDALESWFGQAGDVFIDNSPPARKYFEWGNCFIGYTHGDVEPKGSLINVMATEMPMEWARTKYREWHKGHWHKASAVAFQILDEEHGVRERILPSLVALDEYHSGKGYSHLRESTGMVWNRELGNTDIWMFHPR